MFCVSILWHEMFRRRFLCVCEAASGNPASMLELPWREICEQAVSSLCYVVSLFPLEWSHLIFPPVNSNTGTLLFPLPSATNFSCFSPSITLSALLNLFLAPKFILLSVRRWIHLFRWFTFSSREMNVKNFVIPLVSLYIFQWKINSIKLKGNTNWIAQLV